jgi:hypothetical protein
MTHLLDKYMGHVLKDFECQIVFLPFKEYLQQ